MASWYPNHHHDQHLAGHEHGDCCPEQPGVRIRPVTFAELEDYLEHLAWIHRGVGWPGMTWL